MINTMKTFRDRQQKLMNVMNQAVPKTNDSNYFALIEKELNRIEPGEMGIANSIGVYKPSHKIEYFTEVQDTMKGWNT